MGIIIREADLHADKEFLKEIYSANRGRTMTEAHYNWAYIDNPYGKARAWLAWDDEKDVPVGAFSGYPRLATVQGREVLCLYENDFSVNKDYRRRGIGTALVEALDTVYEDGTFPFGYGHANPLNTPVLHRGRVIIGMLRRFVKVLRWGEVVARRLRPGPHAWLLGKSCAMGDRLLWRSRFLQGRRDVTVRAVKEVDIRFDELFERFSRWYPITFARTAKYLQWRNFQDPLNENILLVLEEGRELKGWAALSIKEGIGYITDFCGLPEPEWVGCLLEASLNYLKATGATEATLRLMETDPLIKVVKSLGFFERPDQTTFNVWASDVYQAKPLVMDPGCWFTTIADAFVWN